LEKKSGSAMLEAGAVNDVMVIMMAMMMMGVQLLCLWMMMLVVEQWWMGPGRWSTRHVMTPCAALMTPYCNGM
jgi:hypothetical protein